MMGDFFFFLPTSLSEGAIRPHGAKVLPPFFFLPVTKKKKPSVTSNYPTNTAEVSIT